MLDSPRAPRVREAARLQQRAARSSTGLFLLEGPASLDEAVRWQPAQLVEVFVTDAARERHADLLERAGQHATLTAVSDRALAALADTVHPQGVVAVARQSPVRLEDAIERAAAEEHPLVAILHEVRDPGNLGTILRAADAAGASAVIVTANSVDPYAPKVVRATTGSLFHVDIAVGASTLDAVEAAAKDEWGGARGAVPQVFLVHRIGAAEPPRGLCHFVLVPLPQVSILDAAHRLGVSLQDHRVEQQLL